MTAAEANEKQWLYVYVYYANLVVHSGTLESLHSSTLKQMRVCTLI